MDRASRHGRTGRSGSIERHGYIVRGALTCRAHVRAIAAWCALDEQSATQQLRAALWQSRVPLLNRAQCSVLTERLCVKLRVRFGMPGRHGWSVRGV